MRQVTYRKYLSWCNKLVTAFSTNYFYIITIKVFNLLKFFTMEKTFREIQTLSIEKTTIALLNSNNSKFAKGQNNFGPSLGLSTVPSCDVTNTSSMAITAI